MLAIVLEKGETDILKQRMTQVLDKVELNYEKVLNSWDGDKEKLEDMIKDLKVNLL